MKKVKADTKSQGGLAAIARYCKPYAAVIIIALLCAVGGAVFSVISPNKLSDITNEIQAVLTGGEMAMKAIVSAALVLVFFYAASFVLSYVQQLIMADITQRLSKKLRREISVKINRLPLKYFDTTSHGDILSRVTNDIDTIGQTLNQSVGTLVSAIALLLGSIIAMFVTNWILALTAIGASLIGFILMIAIVGRSQKYFLQQQKELGAIDGHIEEVYSGHDVVVAYNAQGDMRKQFVAINDRLYACGWKSQFVSGIMMPLMQFIGNFGYVAVCVVGTYLAAKGTITWGTIVAFIVYVRLFTNPLSQIAQAAASVQSARAAGARIAEFLDGEELPDESGKTAKIEDVKGDVAFEHVRFGYDSDKPVIKDFSAAVKAGQKIAIVGPTGAGKTTIVNLLMRFYETDGGSISIDGVPIRDMTRENVHALFGMVLQDTWLFGGTVRENIVYGKHGVSEEQLLAACKATGADYFIKALPQGYDTLLDEATSLSAGQKQLLTITRAMIENAPMLILDEATSSVDTRTEIEIQKAMDELSKGRTSFVIAHRLSTVKNADLILVMNGGDIVESGSHDELLEKDGFYAELYNSQFAQAG